MTTSFNPLTPRQVAAEQKVELPQFAIAAINELLIKKFNGAAAKLTKDEIIDAIMEARNNREMNPSGFLPYKDITREAVVRWVNAEDVGRAYVSAGWSVTEDYSGSTVQQIKSGTACLLFSSVRG